MDTKQAQQLIDKYTRGECTPQEQAQVETWFNQQLSQNSLQEQINYQAKQQEIWAKLPQAPDAKNNQKPVTPLWPRIAAAASILLVTGLGLYFYTNTTNTSSKPQQQSQYTTDIAPGKNTATLTVTGGKPIQLSDAKTGVVIGKNDLSYNDGTRIAENQSASQQMEMQTPKGGQYQATLPDGTTVMLNAASTLKFPSKFTGKYREVELSGEAYFSVKHDGNQPFRIRTKTQLIEDIGTEFNVKAYNDDQSAKTTLVEGAVKISAENKTITLKPGQLALWQNGQLSKDQADLALETAWKNNKFMFESERIQDVMRMVERWYNVQVEYSGEIPDDEFGGSVSRFDNISKVLSKLERTKAVRFKIEGRKVTVSK